MVCRTCNDLDRVVVVLHEAPHCEPELLVFPILYTDGEERNCQA